MAPLTDPPVPNPAPGVAYAPDGSVVGRVVGWAEGESGRIPVIDPAAYPGIEFDREGAARRVREKRNLRVREKRNLRWLLSRPATHRLYVPGATVTLCGRVYRPEHTPLRATADPAKVTCRNCRRSRMLIVDPEPKNVTPR